MKEKELKIYAPKLVQRAGIWIVEYYDQNLKRIRIKKGLNNVSDCVRQSNAQKIFSEIETLRPAPAPIKEENPKLFLDLYDWIENGKSGWRASTYRDNKCKVGVFIKWLRQTETNPQNIKLTDGVLASFFDYLKKERHLNNTTYNCYRTLLLQAFRDLVGKEFTLMDSIKREKERKRGYLYFQDNQISAIKKACEGEKTLWFAIQLMYHCFLRPGEIRLLKWENVNFQEGIITIPYHISKNNVTNVAKIPDVLMSQMLEYKHYAINAYLVSYGMKESFSLIHKSYLVNTHQRILRKLGIDTTVHKLYSWRHTAALKNLLAGVPLPVLSKKMRHHSVVMTEIYLKDAGLNDYLNLCNVFPEL